MKRKSIVFLLALLMTFIMPAAVFADDTTPVAKIGDTEYATLDEAVASAADGDTIVLLADCTTAGMNLSKDLTIKGAYTVTFTKGIALWGKTLTFEDCTVKMTGIGSTPYGEWSWMAICASQGSTLNLNNATMTMDGSGTASGTHAIYFTGNNKLNLTNSTLTIKNYAQDALEWDGGDGGYNVNLKNSTFNSDKNRSGFTGTFYATIDNSNVNVTNSTGNGSNGTYYTIKNNSNVTFTGNRNWGISAWRIDMTNGSTLVANDNGYSGIWTRVLNVDSSCTLDVERNGNHSIGATTNAGIFFQGNGTYTSTIEEGASVTIKNNAGSGIYTNQSVCNLTIGSALITENGIGTVDTYNGYGATYGGGVYNVGTMVLSDAVEIYNNHASEAGDDIYSTKSITFGDVASGKSLDDTEDTNDCLLAIDGWYDDAEDERWTNHEAAAEDNHVVLVASGTKDGNIALKAAHGNLKKSVYNPAEFSFNKIDSETNEALANATFTLTDETGEIVLEAASDEDGLVYFEDIAVEGDSVSYTLKETTAPDGYTLSDNEYTVTFNNDSGTVSSELIDGEFTNITTYSVDSIDVETRDDTFNGTTFKNNPTSSDIDDDEDEDDSDSDTVKTGDSSDMYLWTGLLIGSAIVLAYMAIRKRRSSEK